MVQTSIRLAAAALAAVLLCAAFAPAQAAQQDDADLTLLFTTDVHAHVDPLRTQFAGEPTTAGGFARIATLIAENRAPGSTLLLDSGDYSTGTLYQHFYTTDPLELRLMAALGYDAAALGNHDFDYTDAGLRSCLSAFAAVNTGTRMLCTNLIETGGAAGVGREDNPLHAYGVDNYAVVDVGGYKAGLFALMGKEAEAYIVSEAYAFADPVKTAKATVKQLRDVEKVDIVILLSHCGIMESIALTEDITIAEKVDGIDVILGGHSHVEMPEARIVNDTIIGGAGTALRYLGKMTLQKTDGGWALRQYALLPATENVAADPATEAAIAPYRKRIRTEYLEYYGAAAAMDEPVAYSPYDFPGGDAMCEALGNYPFAQLLCDAYLYGVRELAGNRDVQAVVLPVGSIRQGLLAGPLTPAEIYDTLGYSISPTDGKAGSPFVTGCLTGRDMYDLCETSATLSGVLNAAQLFLGNLRYTVGKNRLPLNRVYGVEIYDPATGAYLPVKRDGTLYKLALSYSAASLVSLVSEKSCGLLQIVIRDESGAPLSLADMPARIIAYPTKDGTRELKEWYALYAYLTQLPKNDEGLPEIPPRYAADAQIFTETSAPFFRNSSKAARIVYGISVLLLAGLAFLLRRGARRKKKRAAKSATQV